MAVRSHHSDLIMSLNHDGNSFGNRHLKIFDTYWSEFLQLLWEAQSDPEERGKKEKSAKQAAEREAPGRCGTSAQRCEVLAAAGAVTAGPGRRGAAGRARQLEFLQGRAAGAPEALKGDTERPGRPRAVSPCTGCSINNPHSSRGAVTKRAVPEGAAHPAGASAGQGHAAHRPPRTPAVPHTRRPSAPLGSPAAHTATRAAKPPWERRTAGPAEGRADPPVPAAAPEGGSRGEAGQSRCVYPPWPRMGAPRASRSPIRPWSSEDDTNGTRMERIQLSERCLKRFGTASQCCS